MSRKLASAVGLILLLMIWVFTFRNRETQSKIDSAATSVEARTASIPPARQLLERQSASRIQSLTEKSIQSRSGASHMRSLPTRNKLQHLTGIISQPGFKVSFVETNVSIADVVDWYPFLVRSDGSTNIEAASKVQNAVYELMEQERADQLMRETNAPKLVQLLRERELKKSRDGIKSAPTRLRDLIASYEQVPRQILALQPLTDISPDFSNLTVSQMRGFLNLLADAQTFAERGADTKAFRVSLMKWAATTKTGIEMTDERAAQLIKMPLEDLVTPVY